MSNLPFQMDSKSLVRLKLSCSVTLGFAWRQRLGSQTEVVPEVPSGGAPAHVCGADSAKATGAWCGPMERGQKGRSVPSYRHAGSCR